MKRLFKKIAALDLPQKLKTAFGCRYFPFVTAAVALFCYFLGLDLLIMYFIAITSALILVFCEDLTPLVSNFLFMSIMVSPANSPSYMSTSQNQGYYSSPAVYSQLIVLVVLMLAAMAYRMAITAKNKKFKLTPTFYGLCALSAAFILNGIFSPDYNPLNLVYGVFMAFFFLVIFVLIKDNVTCTEKTFLNLAYAFAALGAALIVELFIKYVTTENIIVDGVINKNLITFGWGIWNTMGMLLTLCIPPVMYLAGKSDRGYLFFAYAIVLLVAAILTMSRQAMLGAVVIFAVCLVILLLKGKNKLINGIISGVLAAVLIILAGVYHQKILTLFDSVFATLSGANGRFMLWELAWKNFLSAPVFGTGFFANVPAPDFDGLAIIPEMYHNTIMQLLGSCGILGLIAYLIHRAQTIKVFFKNVTHERTFVALIIAALLLMNLVDNHLFYILPTLIYSSLIAILEKSQTPEKPPLLN